MKSLIPSVLTACLTSFLTASITLLSAQAQAYFIATPNAAAIDYTKPTRILLSGRGTDLGIQPQHAALSRALLYQRNFSNDQIILLSVFESEKNKPSLVKGGWKIQTENERKLDTASALPELKKFKKIRSLEMFGHNSPTLGTQTDGLGFRFDARQLEVAALASQFTPDAYAMIHGCNSGWIMAQELSNTWKIAVSGSFSGTRFERLHSDGHFYVSTDSKAPSSAWATSNPEFGVPCSQGGCTRMRPTFSHYNGKWGNFAGPTLSHYKFFCQGETRDCEKRMASSLYGFVTDHSLSKDSTYEEFATAARDYLCPVYKDRKLTDDCHHQLSSIEKGAGTPTVSYVVGDEQLKCSMKSCTGTMTCDLHVCSVKGRVSEGAMTIAQEYAHFLRGFKALKEDSK